MSVEISIVLGDITKQAVDVVVNAANPGLHKGSGVSGAIFRAADQPGPGGEDNVGLLELECARHTHGCHTGNFVATQAYGLANYGVKEIYHAVGPIHKLYDAAVRHQLLADVYAKAIFFADNRGMQSIAFPCISTGAYGFPFEEAAEVVFYTVGTLFLGDDSPLRDLKQIKFVCFDEEEFNIYERMYKAMCPSPV